MVHDDGAFTITEQLLLYLQCMYFFDTACIKILINKLYKCYIGLPYRIQPNIYQ